jgi:predicted phage-related endonuclease
LGAEESEVSLEQMPATREEWLAKRHKHIGASEVAALFGAQPDFAPSHYALWHIKSGKTPAPVVEGSRITWGLKLEEVIATAAAEECGWTVTRGRYAVCTDCQWFGASLDFEISADPTGEHQGPGALETKNVDWIAHHRSWTGGEPPLHILLQLQAQLACTGYSWGAVAALVGGNDLRIYRYVARPKLIADIKSRVTAFWQSIADNKPPPVDGSDSASDVLKALYPEVVDEAADFSRSNEWPEAVATFLDAQAAKKDAEKAYSLARNRVAALLEGYNRGWGGGYSVSVSVTHEKPDRPAAPEEIIKGRAESRTYRAKVKENQ